MSLATNIQILENHIAGNGGDPWPYRGIGITNDNTSSATLSNNYILGNEKGGLAETGASALTGQITNNTILGNGGYDLNLRDMNDIVTGNFCETSNPAGLCPYPLPRFPFDTPANQPPTATFTATTSNRTVTVTDTSIDADGTVVTRGWTFGDGAPATTETSHTYSAAGAYAVMLTVTDNAGATASTAQAVTVSAPIHIGDLDGMVSSSKNEWQAVVMVTVHGASEAPVSAATVTGSWGGGVTGSAFCTTGTTGTCAVSSPQIPKKASSVTFTVTGVTHATSTYTANANHDVDGDSSGTTITVAKP